MSVKCLFNLIHYNFRDIWRQFVSVCRKNNSVLGLSVTFDTFNNANDTGRGHSSNLLKEVFNRHLKVLYPIKLISANCVSFSL